MFNAALFTVAKTWKHPKCPSIEDQIKKMRYVYTVEYYSAIRKDEILPFAPTRTDLENIMLREMSQSQKAKNHMTSFVCGNQAESHRHTRAW